MLGWMCYIIVVSMLLGLAALVFEHSAQLQKRQTRWLWVASILTSLLVPFLATSVSFQLPQVMRREVVSPDRAVTPRPAALREFSPSDWVTASAGPVAASPQFDRVLRGGWLLASLALLSMIAYGSIQLRRRRAQWAQAQMAGATVYIAEDAGPAIVGLLRPRIVVPRWLTAAPAEQQALVVAHEQAHLDGRDAQLLMVALVALVCIPWNVPLWCQMWRLRRAIEFDCDMRVLARGHDIRSYGEALIAVGERQSSGMTVVAAMSESKSFLEQRISNMLRKKTKWTWTTATALACLGLSLVTGAAQVSPPTARSSASNAADTAAAADGSAESALRKEVTLDPAILDRYVGFYQLNQNAVLTVTRKDNLLITQLTGQGGAPVYPQDDTHFFSKIVNAQFTFTVGADGAATSVTLRQGGGTIAMPRIQETVAKQIETRTAERLKTQTANPQSEAAIRRLIDGILSGTPNYNDMSPSLADLVRKQMPHIRSVLNGMGPVKAISFIGVGMQGEDVFSVRHENGASNWRIIVEAKGLITLAAVRPGA